MPKKLTTQEFIDRATAKHSGKYDYSKVSYSGAHKKLTIICPQHGEFEQIAHNHLNGSGCPKCKLEGFRDSYSYSPQEFFQKAKEVHGNRYDYSKSVYTKSHDHVEIVCNKHGSFHQLPYMHLQGQGCPRCTRRTVKSKGQSSISQYIKSLCVNVEEDAHILPNAKQSVDIYCPDHNLAIEYNGSYWHRDDIRGKNFHLNKTLECESKGIALVHVTDFEWDQSPNVVKSMISHRLGLTPKKINARDCHVKEVCFQTSVKFQQDNHIQRDAVARVHLGLYYKDEMVSLMTFGAPRMNKNYEWELVRFCNKTFTHVRGGAGKLFKHFIENCAPDSIITYANRRYSQGGLYNALGFEFVSNSEPGYYYTNGTDYGSRMKYQKHKLKTLFPDLYSDSLTEVDIMKKAGYLRVFDCGNMVFGWYCSQNQKVAA